MLANCSVTTTVDPLNTIDGTRGGWIMCFLWEQIGILFNVHQNLMNLLGSEGFGYERVATLCAWVLILANS